MGSSRSSELELSLRRSLPVGGVLLTRSSAPWHRQRAFDRACACPGASMTGGQSRTTHVKLTRGCNASEHASMPHAPFKQRRSVSRFGCVWRSWPETRFACPLNDAKIHAPTPLADSRSLSLLTSLPPTSGPKLLSADSPAFDGASLHGVCTRSNCNLPWLRRPRTGKRHDSRSFRGSLDSTHLLGKLS